VKPAGFNLLDFNSAEALCIRETYTSKTPGQPTHRLLILKNVSN